MTDHIPGGFHALTPYLHISDCDKFVEWAKSALGATVRMLNHDDGRLVHGEIVIEGSVLELSEATGEWAAQEVSFHLYVPDPDAAYERALENGATSLYEVTNHDYGERSGGVQDPFGNRWYLARVTDQVKRKTPPA